MTHSHTSAGGEQTSGKIRFYASADFRITVNGETGPTGHMPIVDTGKHYLQWCENNWRPNYPGYPSGCTDMTYAIKEYVKCGNPDCQNLHGPYFYAYWKQDKKLNKRYIGKNLEDFRLRKIAKEIKLKPTLLIKFNL